MLERNFQSALIKKLYAMFPGAIVLKNDPNYLQGFPDLLILYGNKWAALEPKRESNANRQNNQEYYIDELGKMSFASFINPDNEQEVLDELQKTFKSRRSARVSRR